MSFCITKLSVKGSWNPPFSAQV